MTDVSVCRTINGFVKTEVSGKVMSHWPWILFYVLFCTFFLEPMCVIFVVKRRFKVEDQGWIYFYISMRSNSKNMLFKFRLVRYIRFFCSIFSNRRSSWNILSNTRVAYKNGFNQLHIILKFMNNKTRTTWQKF